ncbi:hypothetical protein PAMP_000464 [Pampus punctatissimus]
MDTLGYQSMLQVRDTMLKPPASPSFQRFAFNRTCWGVGSGAELIFVTLHPYEVFESKDYLWNKVTVFHSSFLSACEKRQSVKSVSIGHYVLPPASVQAEIRNVLGRLIWEREDEQSVIQGSHKSLSYQTEDEYSEEVSRSNSEPSDTDTSVNGDPECCESWDYPVSIKFTGYVNMCNLQKYSGDLCDFHPVCFQCSNCKAHCCFPHT